MSGCRPSLWNPEPSPAFNAVAKRFCLDLAERAGIVADPTIYSKTRLFRAPNSRHPSGRYKRRLSLDELTYLKPDAILALAVEPDAFDLPTPTATSPTAAADWRDAAVAVERRSIERRVACPDGGPRLNALTLAFIRDGAPDGERATRLFRAAANLAETRLPDRPGSRLAERGRPGLGADAERDAAHRSTPAWLMPGDSGKGVQRECTVKPTPARTR